MSDYIISTNQQACSSAIILNYLTEKKITDETGKRSLLESVYQYPQIAQDQYMTSFKQINQKIEKNILSRFYENYQNMVLQLKDFIDPILVNTPPVSWLPLSATMNYQIPYNKNGILSIVFEEFLWFGGAHPSTEQFSYTYDLCSGKELAAKDILGITEKELKEQIADDFAKQYQKNPEKFFQQEVEQLKNLDFTYHYYVIDEGIVVYFNPYAIGPYVSGVLSQIITYPI